MSQSPYRVECERCKAPQRRKCRLQLPGGRQIELATPHVERQRAAMAAPAARTVGAPAAPRPSLPGHNPATPEEVRAVDCPKCRAAAGEPCWGVVRRFGARQRVVSHHSDRYNAAMAALGRPTYKQLLAQLKKDPQSTSR